MKKSQKRRRKLKRDNCALWKITYTTFDSSQELLREALSTLGNGYFATRGAAYESTASGAHYPGTYFAGVYNRISTRIAGRRIFNDDMVNCPNWLLLQFKIGKGEWIDTSNSTVLSYYQELNMRSAILFRKISLKDKKGDITTIESWRLVSMRDQHRAAIKYTITPENYAGRVTVRSSLDGSVENTGVVRYRQLNSRHLCVHRVGGFGKNGMYLSVKTSQSKIEIAEAATTRIFSKNKELKVSGKIITNEKKRIGYEFSFDASKKQYYVIEKNVSLYTSRDKGIRSPLASAVKCAKNSNRFDTLYKDHAQVWEALWQKFDIVIEGGDPFFQRALRLHAFHLLQTASIHNKDIDAGLPARGLHGEAYRGHVFWDELFVMPFFDFHSPEISKALLLYRFRRLKQARMYARKNGYAGAMFPWQTSATGDEETQVIHLNPQSGKWGPDYSRIQRHVSFAIAYNVWQHWKMTHDYDFLLTCGAEMLVSIARFGASLMEHDLCDGRYHTKGLMGPDEFHEKLPGKKEAGLRDNAYTNCLIVWTLKRAKEALARLSVNQRARLCRKIGLSSMEQGRWDDIIRKTNIIVSDNDIIAQFDGYFGLKELNWSAYRKKYKKIQRLDRILKSEGKSPDEYKLAKQADVLMMFYVLSFSEVRDIFYRLGYKLDASILQKNYAYYSKRTSHGSTLSKVVHCYVSHLLGKSKESWKWFLEILKSDIYDTQGGTTLEGIHAGVMGGSITIVMKGFAGVAILDDRITINPNLPKSWKSLRFNFQFRRHRMYLHITKKRLSVCVSGPQSKKFVVPVEICGTTHHFTFGRTYAIALTK